MTKTISSAELGDAVEQVTRAAHELLASLVSNAPPRDRETEAAKARARSALRFRSPDAGRTGP